ncbi:outer membrane beta-barrel protein [Pseudohongiella sp.]|uniref:Outer membrane protein beta-barrel domain-containing protein n=1 Tax=marine sediment metagenome TaxID=412755 RepID=A0A0F9VZL9_9ZZZZ|nr:outer membrane beta-barrel protein [Pseudohongiella sp.]
MRNIKPLLFAGLMAPGLALADANEYSYVEVAYLQGESAGIEVDGFGINASLEIVDRILAVASFTDLGLDDDSPGNDFDGDIQSFGLGYIFGRNETASVYGTASYIEYDVRGRLGLGRLGAFTFDEDSEGARFELGARMNISPEAEFFVAVKHTDLGAGDNETVPGVGLEYEFLPALSGTLTYERNSDEDLMGLGLRLIF